MSGSLHVPNHADEKHTSKGQDSLERKPTPWVRMGRIRSDTLRSVRAKGVMISEITNDIHSTNVGFRDTGVSFLWNETFFTCSRGGPPSTQNKRSPQS